MSESTPVLEVREATKRFGAVTALDDVSLHCASGEVLALLGQWRRQVHGTQGISGVHARRGQDTLDGVDSKANGQHAVRRAGVYGLAYSTIRPVRTS